LQWWHLLAPVAFQGQKTQEGTMGEQNGAYGRKMEALKHPVADCREKMWCNRIPPRRATHASVVHVKDGKRRGECCHQTAPARLRTMKEAQSVLWEIGTGLFLVK